jgi:hypothetical protein
MKKTDILKDQGGGRVENIKGGSLFEKFSCFAFRLVL